VIEITKMMSQRYVRKQPLSSSIRWIFHFIGAIAGFFHAFQALEPGFLPQGRRI
jgi:hypothetical protein